MITAYGIWPARRHLVVVGVSTLVDLGRVIISAPNETACRALFQHMAFASHVAQRSVVVTEDFLAESQLPVPELALAAGLDLWLTQDRVVRAIRNSAGGGRYSPRRFATILARLPALDALHTHLRCAHARPPRNPRLF